MRNGTKTVRLLQTVPGVGPTTSIVFRTELIDPVRFRDGRQVCAMLGLAPGGGPVERRVEKDISCGPATSDSGQSWWKPPGGGSPGIPMPGKFTAGSSATPECQERRSWPWPVAWDFSFEE